MRQPSALGTAYGRFSIKPTKSFLGVSENRPIDSIGLETENFAHRFQIHDTDTVLGFSLNGNGINPYD